MIHPLGAVRPVGIGTKPQNPRLGNPKLFWAKLFDPKPQNYIKLFTI